MHTIVVGIVRGPTQTVVVRRMPNDPSVHWVGMPDLENLGEGLNDEDDRDQDGEALFGESGDVAHQCAEVKRNDQKQNQHRPHSDPETKRHEVHVVLPLDTTSIRYPITQ